VPSRFKDSASVSFDGFLSQISGCHKHHFISARSPETTVNTAPKGAHYPSKMVYDWENKEEICYRMYIEEKKSLEEIMEYMKDEFKFTPS
jgi:hypothetical protein